MGKNTKRILTGQPILSQLYHFIPDHIIRECVSEHQSDRYIKSFRTVNHLLCLLYGVLTRNSSLRELCKNILFQGSRLMYCGLNNPPCRSTFSDANARRSHQVFASIFFKLYLHYKTELSGSHTSMLINKEIDPNNVEVFDSTTITLFKEILKGAGKPGLDGKKKGGIKVHAQAKLSDMVPHFVCFTSGASNDRDFLKVMQLPEGSVAVFDKGFHSFSKFREWGQSGRYFVTRANDNIKFKVIEQLPVDVISEDGVLSDQVVELTYRCKEEKKNKTLKARLVCYLDPVSKKKLAFLSNKFDCKAQTICLLYQNRWTIEILFKQLKQNFELKYFLSDSPNGVKLQIWAVLILNLIFEVIHRRIKEAEDFSTMVKIAAKNAGSYVNLVQFLQNPYAAWLKDKAEEIRKMQYNLFDEQTGGVFQSSA